MAAPPPAAGRSDDWPAQAADRIESVVSAVASKTTGPLVTLARALVYGTLAGILGTMAALLLAIGLVRAIDIAVPGRVWAAHLLVGATFTLLGLGAWSRRGGSA